METLHLPHLDVDVHLACFGDVTNAPALRSALVDASNLPDDQPGRDERARLDWAFVDAKMVTSKLHLLTAVHQALLAQAAGDLRTKTVHSEILWTLCPTNNISDAIKRFGLSATTTSLILIKVLPSSSNPPIPSIPDQARSLVHGQPLSFDSIPRVLTDWAAVRKVYKLNADPALVELRKVQGKEAEELERMYVDQTVVSLVATKSVAA